MSEDEDEISEKLQKLKKPKTGQQYDKLAGSTALQMLLDKSKRDAEAKAQARQQQRSFDALPTVPLDGGPKGEEATEKAIQGGDLDQATPPSGDKAEAVSAPEDAKEYMEFEKPIDATREIMLAEFDRRKKARSLVLPTDDLEVKNLIRRLDQPACMFGEDKPERRERLRHLVSLLSEDKKADLLRSDAERAAREAKGDLDMTTWYHEGPEALREARIFMLKYSIPKSQTRLARIREERIQAQNNRGLQVQECHKWIRGLTLYSSQFCDTRPISYCQFSPDSKLLATASWSGLCHLWSVPECKQVIKFRGHNEKAACITFHPQSTLTQDPLSLNLVSSAHDGTVQLWSLEHDEPMAQLDGMEPNYVSRVAFHPSGRFLGACCHDSKNSWRLFDLEYNEEILFQEGHSRPVYDVAFHDDGSLAVTGGLDAYARLWDLRTGTCIMFLEGHLKGILSVDFSTTGWHIASGSQDNTVKVWDIRKVGEGVNNCVYTIPAHKNLISKLKYCKKFGSEFLVTASYDSLVKMWTQPGWRPVRTLEGHDSKIMGVDMSPDGNWIVTSAYDKTFKLYAPDY